MRNQKTFSTSKSQNALLGAALLPVAALALTMTSLGALTACSGRHDPAAQSNTEGQTAEPEAAASGTARA